MPRLLVFVPCEKIIIDEHKNISLIALIQNMEILIEEGIQIPSNAVVSQQWGIFAMWEPEQGDAGKGFEQVIQIFWPDGKEFQKVVVPFELDKDKPHTNRVNIRGFPAGQAGPLLLKTWLQEGGRMLGAKHTFKISILHRTAEQTKKATP